MLVFSIVEKFSQIFIYTFNHSYNKKHSLETCTWLLFILMQDFLAHAKPHRVQELFFLPKSAVFYLCYLKFHIKFHLWKTTAAEKQFYS